MTGARGLLRERKALSPDRREPDKAAVRRFQGQRSARKEPKHNGPLFYIVELPTHTENNPRSLGNKYHNDKYHELHIELRCIVAFTLNLRSN